MCPTGKIVFDSPREAREAIRDYKHRRRNLHTGKRVINKHPRRAYKCDVCGKYHLSSK